MPLKLSAFPKCYLERSPAADDVRVRLDRDGEALDCDGLEMYEGFFTSSNRAISIRSRDAIRAAGSRCRCSAARPDFTNPDADARKRAIEKEAAMVRVARRLGGPRTVCRVLSGQRYPDVCREQGLEWCVECIDAVLPVARECDVILGPREPLQGRVLEVPRVRAEEGRVPRRW